MAGGIGSRFWPFSRNHRPKQFLDFFGTGRSLIQMTVDRFRPIIPIENVLIVTNVAYRDLILEQIPDIRPEHVLCEPARRNTAPCIAYAMAHIKNPDARVVVSPSDHLILQEQTFQQVIERGLEFAGQGDRLLTLGMRPTRPETGYGYIQIAEATDFAIGVEGQGKHICKVRAFTEKPNAELAKVFVDSHEFLWNSGIFIWQKRAIKQAFITHLPDVSQKFAECEQYMGTEREEAYIQEMFPSCPNISIDYGVMEKAKNVYVLPADFGWSDLGTWGSLYELSDKDEHHNVTLKSEALYYDSERNIISLSEGHLAVVRGLNDYIIAESDGVLLICPKAEEQQIRQFVTDAEVKFGGRFN